MVNQMSAVDADTVSKVTYEIVSGNVGDKFAVNPDTGVVFVKNADDLGSDYELYIQVNPQFLTRYRGNTAIFSSRTLDFS